MKPSILGFAAVLLLCGTPRAEADLVYDNGPINGTIALWDISALSVTDSFSVSSAASLGMAQVGLETLGDNPATVGWEVGTTAYGSDVSSGTSTLNFGFTGNYFPGGEPIFIATFAISGSVSPGTTYWLTLLDGTSLYGNPIYWDQNNGLSQAQQTGFGSIGSESFQLYGTVPEPGSLMLFGLGALGLAGCLLGRRGAATGPTRGFPVLGVRPK